MVSLPLSSDTHEYRWWIPITFTKPDGDFNNTFSKLWMKDTEAEKEINGMPNENEAVIFNLQQTGELLFLNDFSMYCTSKIHARGILCEYVFTIIF